MLELSQRRTLQLEKPPRQVLVNSMPLLQSVFLSPETHHVHGNLIAFTAASDVHNVTRITRALGLQLAALTNKRILIAAATSLQSLRKEDCVEMPASCIPTDHPNVWVLMNEDEIGNHETADQGDQVDWLLSHQWWEHNPDFGRDLLEQLKQTFDFILVDCGELPAAAIIAPLVDGVIIVAVANRTGREEIRYAQRYIKATGGKLLGFVLDRQRRGLPAWLSRRL